MQQHTGEHIVSGIVHRTFGYDNVGFHLGQELVTMDFNGTFTPEQLQQIEYEANEAVVRNLPIVVTYPSKEELDQLDYRSKKELTGQVRIVEIPGYDVCACCAPHVKLTGEVEYHPPDRCREIQGRYPRDHGMRLPRPERLPDEGRQCPGNLPPALRQAGGKCSRPYTVFRTRPACGKTNLSASQSHGPWSEILDNLSG